MRLYIKQQVFSWVDRFYIKDEFENDRWYAEGEMFSWGRKLHLFDAEGVERAFISRKLMSFFPKYFIEIGSDVYTLIKEFSFFTPKYNLEGVEWELEGNFMAHEYELFSPEGSIMRMAKHWFTWGDSYEMEIPDPGNELLCLCIALAVDCMNADSDSH